MMLRVFFVLYFLKSFSVFDVLTEILGKCELMIWTWNSLCISWRSDNANWMTNIHICPLYFNFFYWNELWWGIITYECINISTPQLAMFLCHCMWTLMCDELIFLSHFVLVMSPYTVHERTVFNNFIFVLYSTAFKELRA